VSLPYNFQLVVNIWSPYKDDAHTFMMFIVSLLLMGAFSMEEDNFDMDIQAALAFE
jgi:hypothetical protein